MEILPVNLFPVGALASSVVTTVWLGVAVVVFFNLRFGWVLSGLVVPGYLVPLLIIKPWAAAVVFAEGMVTYAIVYTLFERLSAIGIWGSVFGRDRFFAIVLVSVGVRIGFDGWLWPALGAWVNQAFDIEFDYRNNLQSFGLIVIALIANQFWKSGIVRGVVPSLTTIAVTYLLVRFVLMPFTNFTVSNIGYMYEDIAASILASPKAYIILLCAAFIASRMNLLYGWDFSGILIPSLLALQWYQPEKILASFAEAFIILVIARGILRLPLFRNASIEGGRKLLLFFNIGFVYKFILAYAVLYFYPQIKITDTYAFGYLLATLLAMKMHDKDIAARMTRATLQTSLAGVVIASLIGFGLTLIPLGAVKRLPVDAAGIGLDDSSEVRLIDRLQQEKVRFYSTVGTIQPVALTLELEVFAEAMTELKNFRDGEGRSYLNNAIARLAQIGYQVERIEDHYLLISEKEQLRGWGTYVLNMQVRHGLLVSVPQPLEERGVLEAAEVLFRASAAHAMAIAGSRSDTNPDRSAAVLLNPQTVFHVFHRVFAQADTLQLRAYSPQLRRSLTGLRPGAPAEELEGVQTRLWVKGSLPASLDLPFLKERAEALDIEWSTPPFANRQREMIRGGFAELLLDPAALRRIRAYAVLSRQTSVVEVQDQRIDGYLQEWILSGKQAIAVRGSDQYRPPELEELLFFDEEILTPLLDLIRHEYHNGGWSQAGQSELHLIGTAAAVMGYRIMQYRHRESGQDFIVLYEPTDNQRSRFWGTYVFRLGEPAGYLVQVPRPLHEINSFEYAVALFERLQGFVLSIAGADPDANRDGGADLVRVENMRSLFSLVNQVVLREAGDTPMMVIHSRARGYRTDTPPVTEDILMSYKRDLDSPPGTDALSSSFLQTLKNDGLSLRYVDGSLETSGYEVGGVPQSRYLEASMNKQFWVLWMSPLSRAAFRQQSENRQEVGRFVAFEIPTVDADLYRYLLENGFGDEKSSVPAQLFVDIRNYLATQNVISLRNIQHRWRQYPLLRLVDRDSRQSFLVVSSVQGKPLLVVNLNPRELDTKVYMPSGQIIYDGVTEFINQRAAWMLAGEPS